MSWKQKGLLGLQSLLGSRRSGVAQPSAPGRGPDRKAGYLGYEGFWLIGPNGADEGRLEKFYQLQRLELPGKIYWAEEEDWRRRVRARKSEKKALALLLCPPLCT